MGNIDFYAKLLGELPQKCVRNVVMICLIEYPLLYNPLGVWDTEGHMGHMRGGKNKNKKQRTCGVNLSRAFWRTGAGLSARAWVGNRGGLIIYSQKKMLISTGSVVHIMTKIQPQNKIKEVKQ